MFASLNDPVTCDKCGQKFIAYHQCPASPLMPSRTDFASWSREGLEHFARVAADENLRLRADNKALLEAWRLEVARTQRLASR